MKALPLKAIAFALVAIALTVYGSPGLSLAVGVVLALTVGSPLTKTHQKAAKKLLQACVVLLGFSMDLGVVLKAGMDGWIFAAVGILATLLLGFGVGKLLGISEKTSALISSGTAICGGSAIAAVGSVIGVADGEIAVAMGTVFMLNAAALYIFPVLGHALHLTQPQFGLWAGVAIHDISSVVGAGSQYGKVALQTATAVKLSRTLWIVPMALGMGYAFRRRSEAVTTGPKVEVPWFIGLFLLASLARSYLPAISHYTDAISAVSKAGFSLVLFAIGAGLTRNTLKAVGWKAAVQGLVLWLFISVAALAVVMHR